jgi:hypothetical protein
MVKGIQRERIDGKRPIYSGAMNGLSPLLRLLLTPVANGPNHLRAKVAVRVRVAPHYGVISANDQDTLRTGASITLTGPGEKLSPMMTFGVTLATALVTPPAHVSPLLSRFTPKEKGNSPPKVSMAIEAGKVKIFLQRITPNTPPQYYMTRHLPTRPKLGGKNLRSDLLSSKVMPRPFPFRHPYSMIM